MKWISTEEFMPPSSSEFLLVKGFTRLVLEEKYLDEVHPLLKNPHDGSTYRRPIICSARFFTIAKFKYWYNDIVKCKKENLIITDVHPSCCESDQFGRIPHTDFFEKLRINNKNIMKFVEPHSISLSWGDVTHWMKIDTEEE